MYVSSSYTHNAYTVQASQKIFPSQTVSTHLSSTQANNQLAEMQEKYKDVYTPMPETYNPADEAFQQQKVDESYPDWPAPDEFFAIFQSYYDGEPLTRGDGNKDFTQEQKEAQEVAYQKTYEHFGGLERFKEMMEGVKTIKNQHPFNKWAKDGVADNAKELARFHNAAVYEGLEQGLNINEASKQARSIEHVFMDTSYTLKVFFGKGGVEIVPDEAIDSAIKVETDLDDPNRSAMDLREYGIEGVWSSAQIIENQDAMLQEIVKKIGQFNFMLNNESLVKEAYQKLDGSYQNLTNNEGYKEWINEELMPNMQLGYKIFSQYQIYDAIDIKV